MLDPITGRWINDNSLVDPTVSAIPAIRPELEPKDEFVPLGKVPGFDVEIARNIDQPIAAVSTNKVKNTLLFPGTGIKETTPKLEVAVGTPEQVIEQTKAKEPTIDEYNTRLLRLSNAVIAERQKEYDLKQKAKAERANTSGIVTGKMGRTLVAANNPNVSKSVLDTVEKVLDIIQGEREGEVTKEDWNIFSKNMTRQADMIRKGHKTGMTNDMERTLFNVQRIASNELESGKQKMESELLGPNKPTNMTEYYNLIDKSYPSNLTRDIGRQDAMRMMPPELLIADNLDQANLPHFNNWLRNKGIQPVTLLELQSSSFMRKKYETEFMPENPYYSFHVENGKLKQNIPTEGKLKAEDDAERMPVIKTGMERGTISDLKDPLISNTYEQYGATHVPRFIEEDKTFTPESMAKGPLKGTMIRGIADRAIEPLVKNAIEKFDGGGSIKEAIASSIDSAKTSKTITGLESPDAYVKTAREIRAGMAQHYNEKKKKAELAVATERAMDNESLDKRLYKIENKQEVVADIWKYRDRTDIVRPLFADGKASDDELRDLAKQIMRDFLNLDLGSRQEQRFERAVSGDQNTLNQEPRIRDVMDVLFMGLSADRGKIAMQDSADTDKRRSENNLRQAEVRSTYPGYSDLFIVFDNTTNKIEKVFNPSMRERAIDLKDAYINPNLAKEQKDEIIFAAGTTNDVITGKPLVGENIGKVKNARILASVYSGNMNKLIAEGYVDEGVINELRDLPSAKVEKDKPVAVVWPAKYIDKASTQARAKWEEGQRNRLGGKVEQGTKQMQAAYIMMRKDFIETNASEIDVAGNEAKGMTISLANNLGLNRSDLKSSDGKSTKSIGDIINLASKRIEKNPDVLDGFDRSYLTFIDDAIKLVQTNAKALKDSGKLPREIAEVITVYDKNAEAYKKLRQKIVNELSKYSQYAGPMMPL